MSDRITLFPNSIGTTELLAVLIFLLKSYFTPDSGVKTRLFKITEFSDSLILKIYAEDTTLLASLSRISILSPIFKLDLSILLVKVKLLIFSIWYLDFVLYIQEFAKISLYVLFWIGFLINSPIF